MKPDQSNSNDKRPLEINFLKTLLPYEILTHSMRFSFINPYKHCLVLGHIFQSLHQVATWYVLR